MTTGEIISLCINGILALATVYVAFSSRSQRREIHWGFEPASKEAFERHIEINRQEHDNIFKKIGGVERGAQAKLEAAIASGNVSREKLHGRINECDQTMGELRGKMEILIAKL